MKGFIQRLALPIHWIVLLIAGAAFSSRYSNG